MFFQPEENEIKIINTLLSGVSSATIGAIVAIATIFFKQKFEKEKTKKEKYDAVKKYANTIILASEELAWRIKEILEYKGLYLLEDAPQNGFFKYKLDSTVYRLCKLLGWIYATKKEQSYIEGLETEHHKEIQEAIFFFQKALADGSEVEVRILDDLIKLFELDSYPFSEKEKAEIGVELENLVFQYLPDDVKKNLHDIDDSKQIELITKILNHICEKSKQPKISKHQIPDKRQRAIEEISRDYYWIYRDWQSAIGEQMVFNIEAPNRRFDVIGFAKFSDEKTNNKWIQKVYGFFTDLDVSVDNKYDVRVQQLKKIYSNLINIITVFKQVVNEEETILPKSYNDLYEFKKEIDKQITN